MLSVLIKGLRAKKDASEQALLRVKKKTAKKCLLTDCFCYYNFI